MSLALRGISVGATAEGEDRSRVTERTGKEGVRASSDD